MLFNSLNFLIFFPAVIILYFLVPHKFRYLWLLVSSYFFYMCWNPVYILLILSATVFTYFTGLVLDWINNLPGDLSRKSLKRKICVGLCVGLNLMMLGYFKYMGFFVANLNIILSRFDISVDTSGYDILLPVGISFYTFQAIGYVIDVYREKIRPEKNFLKYALFISFFPQLVAGPIERSENLLMQINERHSFDFQKARDGFLLMLWGYFLKLVIADRIVIFVDKVYADPLTYGGFYLVVASVLFAFQIYCDFAGYSIIAMGAAEIMGFRLTDNFNCPYMARSVAEFWRRWHITLFSWFRDYVYVPLGGSRKGKVRRYINIMIVFLLSGLWHGAQWNYVIWGALNGIYQIVGRMLMPFRDKAVRILKLDRTAFSHKLLQAVATFILIDFSWIFFRAEGLEGTIPILKSILHADNVHILFDNSLFALGLDWKNFMVMLIAIIVLLYVDFLKYKGIIVREVIARQEIWFRWMVAVAGVLVVLVFGIWGSGYDSKAFIYFQF